MKPLIVKIEDFLTIDSFTDIIKNSFLTVANQYGLTAVNSPTNPAFTTEGNMIKIASRCDCFGVYINHSPCGFFALELTDNKKTFYLERVCVLPQYRHNGIGTSILSFAEAYCKNHNAEKISIGIMNQNSTLKKWYQHNGYAEISVKQFPHLKFDVCFLENRLK